MRKAKIFDEDYKNWLVELKSKMRSVQVKAAFAVNSALIGFYWDLGKMITEKQAQTQWGSQFLERLAKDLQTEFPNMQGLSLRNLKYTRQFYEFYSSSFSQPAINEFGQQPVAQLSKQSDSSIGQQVVAQLNQHSVNLIGQQPVDQLPWGHNILIFSKSANINEAAFYINKL